MPSAWKGGKRIKTAQEYAVYAASRIVKRKLGQAVAKRVRRIKKTPGYSLFSEQMKEANRLIKLYGPKKEPKGTHRA